MTTFVVSLFLPYTVDFKDSTLTPQQVSKPVPKSALVFDASFKRLSLLSETPPQSPSLEPFTFSQQLDPSSPTIHFAKPHDPRSLAHSDANPPEWGRAQAFGQPLSRAAPVPPSTILQYRKSDLANGNFKHDGPIVGNDSSQAFSDMGWVIKPSIHGNGGLRNAVNEATLRGVLERKTLVGSIGFPTDVLDEKRKQEIHDWLEHEHDALTVFVGDDDFDGHYRHFCKTILWPVFHYQIPDHPKSKAYEDHSWIYYVKVNEAFAAKVVQNYKHGDVIWIHDYHLLLVPALIRKSLPDARIGFFLHTAFPSSEVFRVLAARKQLLEGVLGSNVVVFQTHEYVHHFLQTCSRLLVVEATEFGVQLDDHFVDVQCIPIGVIPNQIETFRGDQAVVQWIDTVEQKYKGKKLLVSRDKLDNIRGIKQKLLAYERFLETNPDLRENVVLFQVAATTALEGSSKDTTVSDIVTRINSQFSTLAHQPLVFLKQDIAFAQYLALLSVADVLLVTSLREGMNLTSHDYIICQNGNTTTEKRHGPLILSEFTGSAALFRGMDIAVNPWDYNQIARAIKHALSMSSDEKALRHSELLKIVMENDGASWILHLGEALERAYEDHQIRDAMAIPRLSVPTLCEQYKASASRCFILDYEGTLAFWGSPGKAVFTSPERVISVLSDLMLASDLNIVYVASARTPAELEHLFRQLPTLGLIAENGCFVRPFGGDEWIDIGDTSISASSWKEGVLDMLSYYNERIEGSWIEERNRSIVFHYENVAEGDIEAAERQAGDAGDHINENCLAQRMRAVPVDKALLVEPCDVSKETAARWILSNLQRRAGSSVVSTEGTRAPSELDNNDLDETQQESTAESTTITSDPVSVPISSQADLDGDAVTLHVLQLQIKHSSPKEQLD
ncbi:MAG: hypothetical protein M1828_000034 [Chrysothrix sp. TS-e1954]|nr:MAG: hypothetical protein M1828_000034 [Chrysothrix sp. TS-e1954]